MEAQRQAGNRLWIKSLAHGDVSAKLMPPAAPNDELLPIFCLVTQLSGFSLLLQGSRHLPDPSTGHWRRPTTWAQCICIADEPNPEVKTTARERLASLAMPCWVSSFFHPCQFAFQRVCWFAGAGCRDLYQQQPTRSTPRAFRARAFKWQLCSIPCMLHLSEDGTWWDEPSFVRKDSTIDRKGCLIFSILRYTLLDEM